MLPHSRRFGILLTLAILAGAAAAIAFMLGPRLAGSVVMLAALMLVSLLAGAIVAYWVEHGGRQPVDRYRREHERLAGPRPGARLGP